jgi:hypothetical protein
MHPYATNLSERRTIPLYIAGFAFFVAWGISTVMSTYQWQPPFWLSVPGAAGIYGLGYELFKHRLWRVKILRVLCRVRTPDISGHWQGVVKTSFDKHAEQHSVSVEIGQTWTDLSIRLRSSYSQSWSLIGAITVDDQNVLTYEYMNEPIPGAVATMNAHRGTARLVISADGNQLEGEYYSGRGRENQGVLILGRQDVQKV